MSTIPAPEGAATQSGPSVPRDGRARGDDDAHLVDAIRDGDHDAMAAAYERHGDAVYRVACRYCGVDQAGDVTQDVFLRLWRAPERFVAARGSLRTFLTVQARCRAIDLVRSTGARRSREGAVGAGWPVIEAVDVEAVVTAGDDRAEVLRCLGDLPRTERVAISLAYYGGFTYREVADLLDQPEGTIKGRIRSGLRRLRQDLVGPGGDERAPAASVSVSPERR